MNDKAEIRRSIKTKKSQLTRDDILKLSKQVESRLFSYLAAKTVDSIHIYQSMAKFREVETPSIIKRFQKQFPSAKVFAPASKLITEHLLLTNNLWKPVARPDHLELILVPLVSFDDAGNRIGHGGGYYDRFLKLYPRAEKIGLAFEMQKVSAVPAEAHDQRLDKVITETNNYEW